MTNAEIRTPYDRSFYREQVDGSLRSARIVLERVFQLYQPRSVLDVGCGRGCWLLAAEELGSTLLEGLDGSWVQRGELVSSNIKFTPVNFEQKLNILDRYDLCISLEVAEHLTESRAREFVGTLCAASDIVLFSAAIEQQGGTNHLNERWQSYWIALFESYGYECLDVLRSQFWENTAVEVWYRQNAFIFVNRSAESVPFRYLAGKPPIIDMVHPEQYAGKIRQYMEPTLRFCLACFVRYGKKIAKDWFKKVKRLRPAA